MTSDELARRLETLLSGADVAGPLSTERVDRVETELGVVLPRSYRVFLEKWGACNLPELTVAGVDPARVDESECPYWDDCVRATLALRRASRDHLPKDLVFISDDGGDYKFYLDTAVRDTDGECPVLVLGPGMDGDILATSFLAFLERAVRGDELFTGPPWR